MTAIDISSWQGNPNFAQIKAAGVQLVIMKAGGGEPGTMYTDRVYKANRAAARAQGLPVGSYFFNGPVDPTAAADFHWSICDYRAGDLVAIDVENSTGVTRWNPAQVLAYCQRMIAHGVPARNILVYMSSSVTRAADWSAVAGLGTSLWVAQYGTNNGQPQGSPSIKYWGAWAIWQYTSTATCPGVSGRVDTNLIAAGWASVNEQKEEIDMPQGFYPRNKDTGSIYYMETLTSPLLPLGQTEWALAVAQKAAYADLTPAAVNSLIASYGTIKVLPTPSAPVVKVSGALTLDQPTIDALATAIAKAGLDAEAARLKE